MALAVGHEKRFEPPILALMQLIKSGDLGTPLQLEANVSQDKFEADYVGREISRAEDARWVIFPYEEWWKA